MNYGADTIQKYLENLGKLDTVAEVDYKLENHDGNTFITKWSLTEQEPTDDDLLPFFESRNIEVANNSPKLERLIELDRGLRRDVEDAIIHNGLTFSSFQQPIYEEKEMLRLALRASLEML
jgi:hypothetical protein